MRQVAGPHRGAPVAKADIDGDFNLLPLQVLGHRGFVVIGEGQAVLRCPHAAKSDAQFVAVSRLPDIAPPAPMLPVAALHDAPWRAEIMALVQDMAATLKDLVASCRGDHRADCPILERLETDLPGEDLTIHPRKGAV